MTTGSFGPDHNPIADSLEVLAEGHAPAQYLLMAATDTEREAWLAAAMVDLSVERVGTSWVEPENNDHAEQLGLAANGYASAIGELIAHIAQAEEREDTPPEIVKAHALEVAKTTLATEAAARSRAYGRLRDALWDTRERTAIVGVDHQSLETAVDERLEDMHPQTIEVVAKAVGAVAASVARQQLDVEHSWLDNFTPTPEDPPSEPSEADAPASGQTEE